MPVCFPIETARLQIRPLTLADAPFILRLLNEPSFIENIADKGVRTLADAETHLLTGPLASYAEFGFGMFRVNRKESDEAIGLCGLLKRPYLPHPDIGYAYLPEYFGRGYAAEAARAIVQVARDAFALDTLMGMVSPTNTASQNVLKKLGLVFLEARALHGDTLDTHVYQLSLGTR